MPRPARQANHRPLETHLDHRTTKSLAMRASTTAGRSDCANNPFERWIEKRADKLIVTLALVAVALTWGEGDAGRVRVGVWQDCALRDLKTVPRPPRATATRQPWRSATRRQRLRRKQGSLGETRGAAGDEALLEIGARNLETVTPLRL